MAKIGFFTHMFGGPRKKAEAIIQELKPPFFERQIHDVVLQMRREKINDVMMIMTMWDVFQDPSLVVKAAIIDKAKNFPNLTEDLLTGWPWGDDNLWKGFLTVANGSKARAAGLLAKHHPDKDALNTLFKAFCPSTDIINEYISSKGIGLEPLGKLWKSLGRDIDSLWAELKKDRGLFEAVSLLLDILPDNAGDIIAMNLNISTMVEELIAKSPDQGGLFARVIDAMRYPMTKFWRYVLEFQNNNKKAAVRFVFVNGQDLLSPMLMAIINDPEISETETAPSLQDIVAVFAEESGEEEDEEDILTAEQVVNQLGWTGADIWTAVSDYTAGNIAEAVMLISRHFPGQIDELVFQQMDMSYILREIGEHFRGRPGRADLFCRRNKIDYRQALTAILEFAADEEVAVKWFCECFPRTAAKNLSILLQEDPDGAADILAAPWSDQTVWLALVDMLDCENAPEEAFVYVQQNWPFYTTFHLAKGMADDGYPPDEVLITYMDGTTGPLPDFPLLVKIMKITLLDAMHVLFRFGEERKGMRDTNQVLSDLCERVEAIESSMVWRELARRKSALIHEPDKLTAFILTITPGLVRRKNGVPELWKAFKQFYDQIDHSLFETLHESIIIAIRRDRTIEMAPEDIVTLAKNPNAEADQYIIATAERLRFPVTLFINLLRGDISGDLVRLATLDPTQLEREHKQVLRTMGLEHEQLMTLLQIQKNPAAFFPVDIVAEAAQMSPDHVKAIVS